MQNKYILITGASSGIGRETAIYLASQGANVLLVARSEEKLKAVQSEIGERAKIFACDLNETDVAKKLFDFCESIGWIFDGMVYSAGIAQPVPIRTISMENVDKTMSTNCISFLEIGKYFYNRKYSTKGASIVAISSMAAVRPVSGQVAYAASKAALNSVVEVMSKEFLKRGIRVNSIMPSYVATPMVSGEVSYGMNNGIENMPLGVIEPKQISYLAEFLLSDKAKHITGAAIPVTSGV